MVCVLKVIQLHGGKNEVQQLYYQVLDYQELVKGLLESERLVGK